MVQIVSLSPLFHLAQLFTQPLFSLGPLFHSVHFYTQPTFTLGPLFILPAFSLDPPFHLTRLFTRPTSLRPTMSMSMPRTSDTYKTLVGFPDISLGGMVDIGIKAFKFQSFNLFSKGKMDNCLLSLIRYKKSLKEYVLFLLFNGMEK